MSGDSTMSGLSLDGAIRADEDGSHETKGTEALSEGVGLDITVVVLASPDESTFPFNHVGDHSVNKPMAVLDAGFLKFSYVFLVKHLLEDVLEATIVLLKDGVLSRKI